MFFEVFTPYDGLSGDGQAYTKSLVAPAFTGARVDRGLTSKRGVG